ncbi:MAG: type II toxin-antitoxin system RelE/ParE family toxin [Nitrospira sp.]|nr:type II toxin-antitoxin system RelE/ParE family toxin [Nitrospira sp.]
MPGCEVFFHPAAVEEAQAARAWYLERSISAADSFLAELDHAIEAIAQTPDRWPGFVHGTRRYVFHHFPFQLIYRVSAGHVQIIAIAHGRRRPGYWKAR